MAGNMDDVISPKVVEALKEVKIVDVSCGREDGHSLAADSEGAAHEVACSVCVCVLQLYLTHAVLGCLWSWGDNSCGKLGLGPNSDKSKSTPTRLDQLNGVKFMKVCCGSHTSVALTTEGQVFTW